MICLLVGLMAALLSGKLINTVTTMPGIIYVFLTFWMFAGLPFSVWIGGAFGLLREVWIVSVSTFLVIASNLNLPSHIRAAINCLGCALLVTLLAALLTGTSSYGRLGLDSTRFGDPNDLALLCVLGLPILAFIALNTKSVALRLVGATGVLLAFYIFLKTGSRGGMLGMAVLMMYFFFRMSLAKKALVVLMIVGALAVAPLLVSPEVIQRFTQLSKDADEEARAQGGMAQGANDSAQARWNLFQQSLVITASYPIFGVGMGNFMIAENDLAVSQGKRRGDWHVTHNMYTQLSSEAGIPALIAFIVMLVYCWRNLSRVERSNFPQLSAEEQRYVNRLAFALKATMIGYMTCGAFLGVAYVGQVPVLVAIISRFCKIYLPAAQPLAGHMPGVTYSPIPRKMTLADNRLS